MFNLMEKKLKVVIYFLKLINHIYTATVIMFYIQPPKGLVTLHTLEEIVFTRLEYLQIIKNNDKSKSFNGKFEYLFENSPYDCIGHFTLRLLTSRFKELFSFWLKRETLLFQQRLILLRPRQLYKLLKTVSRHISRRDNSNNPVDKALVEIISFFLQLKVFKHLISKNHSEDCTHYHQKVDFELLLDLVETRSVELWKGSAVIYCSQWQKMLQSLFKTFIMFEVKNQSSLLDQLLTDPRFHSISQKLESKVFTKDIGGGRINAANIDDEAFYFPPCMEHLHLELRRKHRLSHYARFYYTLFLKECGMSLEDALVYWRHEYSKPHSCTSLCTHDWQTDAKKFTYSIRHMYGLEGAKRNYKTPNCKAICEQIPGSNYEGGCPFGNFDKDSLKFLLQKSMTKQELNIFMENVSRQKPQDSCAAYLKFKNISHMNNITISKPVQYYMTMIKMN